MASDDLSAGHEAASGPGKADALPPANGPGPDPEVDSADGLRALAADGLSAREIGERLGISQRTVRRRLESHGIERANGRAQRVPLIIVPPGAETAGQSFGPAGELLRVLTYVNEQIAEYNAERSARSRDDLDHLIESAAIHLRQCGYRMERADA